ncbi:Protein RICE SALT SENSITIVE 3 [Linum perenne]
MEGGFPLLNSLLHYTLRSLCSTSSHSNSSSSKWVYAVFWRILPRNYPPPKWDHSGTALDRSKGNQKNWMLVWEDGFCDFLECERQGSGKFGAHVFFKLSHEVYSYGEGFLGKVAAERSHKWVFSDSTNDPPDPNAISSSLNMAIEPQPRAWESQFNSGIQTIAIISVREGIIQLGSFHKIVEDLNLVINIQRKFSYLHSIPGETFTTQSSFLPIHHPYIIKHTNAEKPQTTGMKRAFDQRMDDDDFPIKSINGGGPEQYIFSIPPLLPTTMSLSCGPLLSKLQYPYDHSGAGDALHVNSYSNRIKSEDKGLARLQPQ